MNNNRSLIIAACDGDLHQVKILCDDNIDEEYKNTALHLAARDGHMDIVKFLCENNADINSSDGRALHNAIQYDHIDIFKYLHQHRGNINLGEYLVTAVSSRNLDIVVYLCENGADIRYYGGSALMIAAERGDLNIVKYLYEQGADIHSHDDTALHHACINGHIEMVKYLCDMGANIYGNGNGNRSVGFIMAIRNGHLDVIEYLFQKFYNIRESTDTSLLTEDGVLLYKYLYENGYEIGVYKILALCHAIYRDKLDIIIYLFQNCEYCENSYVRNYIMRMAAQHGSFNVVKHIFTNDLNVDDAFKIAAENNYCDIIKFLLQNGIKMSLTESEIRQLDLKIQKIISDHSKICI